jgi:hypothetical protein
MVSALDDSHLSGVIDASSHQFVGDYLVFIFRVQPVVALELLNRLGAAVRFMCDRSGDNPDALTSANQRTAQAIDDELISIGLALFVSCVSDSGDVAGML